MNDSNSIDRRAFLSRSAKGLAALAASSLAAPKIYSVPRIADQRNQRRVIVLGIDGMDPRLLNQFVQKGFMPNFKRFIDSNHFSPLQTTMPPQSPVAWSSFITGANPGRHGIFDFIHRNPETFTPYFSTARTTDAKRRLKIGKWSIPLESSGYEQLRHGRPFWWDMEDADIPATLIKLPVSFPVYEGKSRVLTGMGTPDILGTYGTFTLFSEVEFDGSDSFTGGRLVRVLPDGHHYQCPLYGPPNPLRSDGKETRVDIDVYRDPWEDVIKVDIQGEFFVLKKGEWSQWIPVQFNVMSLLSSVHGMVRVYVKQVHPHLLLYVSPINVDPASPDAPISYPRSYSEELSRDVDRFYTQGFPEDTKALSHGVFSSREFLEQSKIVLRERLAMYTHELNGFQDGLFFYYFSSTDQNSHMMLRNMMPSHPLYEPDASDDVKNAIRFTYIQMDHMLAQTLKKVDDRTTLMILSDHGFSPFVREFNLSTWLVEEGFTAVENPQKMESSVFYDGVDWENTQAYVMGLNSIYINRSGREVLGSVYPGDVETVKQKIIERLEDVRDPESGRRIVSRAFDGRKLYSGSQTEYAPDIIVGYNSGYRISDEAVLGKFPKPVVRDRLDKWSADHCMDFHIVPGVFLANRKLIKPHPAIWDLAPSILNEFGLAPSDRMDGKLLFIV